LQGRLGHFDEHVLAGSESKPGTASHGAKGEVDSRFISKGLAIKDRGGDDEFDPEVQR
jgi:hypothetical protein